LTNLIFDQFLLVPTLHPSTSQSHPTNRTNPLARKYLRLERPPHRHYIPLANTPCVNPFGHNIAIGSLNFSIGRVAFGVAFLYNASTFALLLPLICP
jgi:hypothetical protein